MVLPYQQPTGSEQSGLSDSSLLRDYFEKQARPAAKPLPKPGPRPKIDDLKDEWTRLKQTFETRNSNIRDWRRFTRVEDEYRTGINGRFTNTREDDEPISVTQSAIIVRRRVQKVGNLALNAKVTPGGPTQGDEENATKTNKFMNTARQCWDDDYRNAGGSSSRQQAVAQYTDEDGSLFTWVRPVKSRPSMPFAVRLMEPTQCYPVFGTRDGVPSLVRFYEVRFLTLRELQDEYGKDIKIKDREGRDDDAIEVLNFCDWDYTAIWSPDLEQEWIRKPAYHGYGTIPVVASFNGGFPSVAGESRQLNANEREATRGRSVIADHVGTLGRIAQHLAALKQALFKAVDPPLHVANGRDEQSVQVERAAGSTTQTDVDTKINPLFQSPNLLPITQSLMSHDMDSLRLDNLLLDPNVSRSSGFDRVVAALEAEETMSSLVSTVEDHESRVQQTMLTMYQYLRNEEGMQAAQYFDEEGTKGGTYNTFDPAAIPDYPHVTCKLETLSNVNRLQLIGQAGAAVQSGVASAKTLRELAGIEDSDLEQTRIQEEMARMNPEFMKLTSPVDMLVGIRDRMRQAEQRGNRLEAEAYRIMFAKQVEGVVKLLETPATPPQPPVPPPGMGMPPGMDPSMMMQQGGPMGPPSSLGPVGVPGGIPPELASMGMDDMSAALAGAGGVGPIPGGPGGY